ncbi:MAG: hypothetical protein ACE5GZ_01030 [Gammaproteobacteria bacterium]
MWVVKLGGSLQQTSSRLDEWLNILSDYGGGKVIIVPGGGRFAGQVRSMQSSWGFGDVTAHRMALLGMQQFAYMLLGLETRLHPAGSNDEIMYCLQHDKVPVWLPYEMIVNNEQIPASWEMSADSLALWLAGQLQAEHLVLIKSVKLPNSAFSIEQLSDSGLLDACFPGLLQDVNIPVTWLARDEQAVMTAALQQNRLPNHPFF